MGVNEEFLRLITEVKGDQAIVDLKKKLADLELQSQLLKIKFELQAISEEELEVQTRKLAATSNQLKNVLGETTNVLGETTNKMAGLGQTGLQAGRVVQDFAQGGLAGIINNVEGLAMALGGGPGLAGALTIAFTAALVLKPLIIELTKEFGSFWKEIDLSKTSADQLAEKIKELNEKPIKLTADTRELEALTQHLEQLRKDEAAAKALAEGKSPEQLKAGQLVSQALMATGEAPQIQRELQAQRFAELAKGDKRIRTPEQIKAIAEAREAADAAEGARPINPAYIKHQVDQLTEIDRQVRDKYQKQAFTESGNLYERAKSGTDKPAVAELAARLAAGGRGALAEKIGGISPESVKAAELTEAGEAGAEIARKEREKIKEDEHKAAEEATEFEVKHEDHMTAERKKHTEAARKAAETFAERQTAVDEKKAEDMAKFRERTVGVFTTEAKKGTLDEFATAKAAELQAQGGYTSSKGRFIPLDAGGQRAALQGELEKRIGGEYGGASKGVAAGLTREAFGEVERKSADLTAAGFGQAAANQAVMNESIQALQAQVAKLAGVGKQIGRGRDGQVSRLGVTR